MAQLKEGSIIKKSTGDEVIATLNDIPGASSIPTKTSELENDSGFITSSEIPEVDVSTLMPISSGAFNGIVKAHPNTSYTVAQSRNIILSTGDAVASLMEEGEIWIKYI